MRQWFARSFILFLNGDGPQAVNLHNQGASHLRYIFEHGLAFLDLSAFVVKSPFAWRLRGTLLVTTPLVHIERHIQTLTYK